MDPMVVSLISIGVNALLGLFVYLHREAKKGETLRLENLETRIEEQDHLLRRIEISTEVIKVQLKNIEEQDK
jgi:hypothetical protein